MYQKEGLCDFLNETRLLNKPIHLTKTKVIELTINDWVIKKGNSINILTNNTHRLTINNT